MKRSTTPEVSDRNKRSCEREKAKENKDRRGSNKSTESQFLPVFFDLFLVLARVL